MTTSKTPTYQVTSAEPNEDGSTHINAVGPDGQTISFDLSHGSWAPPEAVEVMRRIAREEIDKACSFLYTTSPMSSKSNGGA